MKYLLILLLLLSGCSWTAYNSTEFMQDPLTGELIPVKQINAGRIALASDIDLSKLSIKSGDKELFADKIGEEQDSIQGWTPWGPWKTTD